MTYPPPNPYDPNRQHQPGYGQPSQPSPAQPPHFTTEGDPYARPDQQYTQPPYPNPPMNVGPGPMPQGGITPPPPPGPGGAFQPGQAAPPPPRGSSNAPLLVTLGIIVVAVVVGGIFIAMTFSGEDEPQATDDPTTEAATESPSAEETTTEAAEEETTEAVDEAVYRLPEVDECIENVEEGFYVVPCDSDTAYWLVLHIEKNPDDPDPEDMWHSTAAYDSCNDYDYDQYYFTDTSVAAGRDWDPEIDSITAIYCVAEVEGREETAGA